MTTKIGIDLGTSNSLVAYWTESGSKIIPNVLGDNLTPSVVSVDENDEILVGKTAKERLLTHPQCTAAVFKRYMGTEKNYQLGRYTFTPEELSSFILKALKADAEAYLQEEISEAVISVPAYFNDTQRRTTKRAAELAGLQVERLISEPTAAAIAYGLHQEEEDTKFLVFDLGGGTFDVSILEFFEGIMEVQSIAGDNYLGGEDFTQLLVNHFIETQDIDKDALKPKTLSLLTKQAEICKYKLSENLTAAMSLTIDEQTRECTVSRSDFERLAGQLMLRLRHPIERALRDASLSPAELDAVILIGGATRMPVIRTIISKMFGRLPFSHINPDEAVAIGAAVQSALKGRDSALKEIILTDVCPYTLGTGVAKQVSAGQYDSGHYLPIIERNTPIPVSKVERLYTIRDNQSKIEIEIYQGENRRVENNLKLGKITVKVPPAPGGEQAVDVRYTYDINGILEVEVTIVSTGKKTKMIIEENPGNLTQAEIKAQLEKLKDIKVHPRERTENRLLLAWGERLFEEFLGEKREQIAFVLEQFERILSSQNELQIKKAAALLKEQLETLERRVDDE